MKKTILLLMIAFGLCAINKAMAQPVVASGTTGDCTWTITGTSDNYTLTISGNGATGDYDLGDAPWSSYGSNIKAIIIENGVTTIGSLAFSGYRGLTSVDISNSVTTIGDYAFSGCWGLPSVTIPNSVTTIGDWTFQNCSGLTGMLTIPNSVTTIGEFAFANCTGLTSVTIGNSVTTIGDRAFYGCSGLTSVIIGNSVTTIGDRAFDGCRGLTELYVKAQTPPVLGSDVFVNVPATVTVHVPSGTADIYRSTFGRDYFSNYVDDIHLSVLPVENEAVVSVSPNPVREVLYIQSPAAVEQVSIYNLSGQPVKQIVNPSPEVDVNDLSNGLYFIKIETAAGEVVRKIMKK
ncbi:MAG: leucine-rich repeat protein [Dysgonamonadaceae bacterium]|nr:leucine-rich repeat protein [Dysgonamonadaceae bacterium]